MNINELQGKYYSHYTKYYLLEIMRIDKINIKYVTMEMTLCQLFNVVLGLLWVKRVPFQRNIFLKSTIVFPTFYHRFIFFLRSQLVTSYCGTCGFTSCFIFLCCIWRALMTSFLGKMTRNEHNIEVQLNNTGRSSPMILSAPKSKDNVICPRFSNVSFRVCVWPSGPGCSKAD